MADVDDQSATVALMAEVWPMIDALMGGTKAMRAAAKTLLPQWPNEDDDSYKTRLGTAVLHPVFQRTCQVMAAKPLARPIVVDKSVPTRITDWFGNIDMHGTSLHAFVSQVMLACMSHGLHGVLVDYPQVAQAKTKADEQASGARPYWTQYPAKAILGWRATDGKLTQLRLLETVVEDDGEFGEKAVDQVRVLTPGAWNVWRKPEGKQEFAPYQEGTTTIKEIPFRFFYGIRKGFGVGATPLLDLAYQNVEHWQAASDQQTILHVARVPILFAKMFGDSELTIGAASAAQSDSPEADLRYVEHTGAAIEAGRQAILDLEERMRQSGAELLVQQPTLITATQVVSDGEANKSILQRIVEEFEASLNGCLELTGEWVGDGSSDGVTLFKDFGASALSDQSAQTLHNAATAKHISKETVFDEFQRRNIISADRTWAAEKIRLQGEVDTSTPAKGSQAA